MKSSRSIFIFLPLIMLPACVSREPLLSLPLVSMTEVAPPKASTGEETGTLSAQYCPGDTPLSGNTGQVGLMDEAALKGQKEKNARWIKQAQFFRVGNCVLVEGTGLR